MVDAERVRAELLLDLEGAQPQGSTTPRPGSSGPSNVAPAGNPALVRGAPAPGHPAVRLPLLHTSHAQPIWQVIISGETALLTASLCSKGLAPSIAAAGSRRRRRSSSPGSTLWASLFFSSAIAGRILEHLHLPSRPLPLARAQDPPQLLLYA